MSEKNVKKELGTFALLMTGLGTIIGSGWLFGAWKAASVAGPAAIIAWILGMIATVFIGLTYAELGTMFPQTGGMVRYAQHSHGPFVGFLSGWANWIAIVSVIPVEAVASVQYMSSWPWDWAGRLYDGKELSSAGLILAGALIIVYFLLNFWTVRLFATANSAITVFKLVVPLLTVLGLIAAGFHTENFTSHGGFAPYGWSGVLTAVATSGVVFAFNGFQSPVNLAGEAKNPNRSIPIAVVGSILMAGGVYVLLQIAFIGAVSPEQAAKGWSGIHFNSPFADLAIALNLNWLALLLFADAFVSPSGAGVTNTATTARMVYGMKENGHMPKVFGVIHPIYGVPRAALCLNLAVAFVFLFLFRGWGSLAEVISVATLISYATGPVAVMVLRQRDTANRPIRVKGMGAIAPVAFILASLILYWATWPLTGKVVLIMVLGLPIYLYYQSKEGWADFIPRLKAGLWLIGYLAFMVLISCLGSERFGGLNLIPYGADMVLIAALALVFYFWGIKSARPFDSVREGEGAERADRVVVIGFRQ
ncbi:amino acid/polyamine/organocation transporter (APC superfamily) [Planifilum fimeticola]|uniref:Amino acid/polyamine/organocation transporter (APC superfamily) n=1 Tax=Planifilum fimeticola TaxID=201975 RepID=A0A2T0LAJ3_9BACL|nr:amino acid/polyamine/organocation transporter (APC superfamily) [Planifilum fimeticola]